MSEAVRAGREDAIKRIIVLHGCADADMRLPCAWHAAERREIQAVNSTERRAEEMAGRSSDPEPRTGINCACDWPGCTGQCHTGDTCPCHPEAAQGAAPRAEGPPEGHVVGDRFVSDESFDAAIPAAPRAEGLDVERLREAIAATWPAWEGIVVRDAAERLYARLSRPSDERVPEEPE